MTDLQCYTLTKELIEKTTKQMQEDLDKLLKAGCLDLESQEAGSYALPKAIMSVLCNAAAAQWYYKEMDAEIQNMKYFI